MGGYKKLVIQLLIHSFWINNITKDSVEVVEVHLSSYDDSDVKDFTLTYLTLENEREHTTISKFLEDHTYIPPKKEYTYGKLLKHVIFIFQSFRIFPERFHRISEEFLFACISNI